MADTTQLDPRAAALQQAQNSIGSSYGVSTGATGGIGSITSASDYQKDKLMQQGATRDAKQDPRAAALQQAISGSGGNYGIAYGTTGSALPTGLQSSQRVPNFGAALTGAISGVPGTQVQSAQAPQAPTGGVGLSGTSGTFGQTSDEQQLQQWVNETYPTQQSSGNVSNSISALAAAMKSPEGKDAYNQMIATGLMPDQIANANKAAAPQAVYKDSFGNEVNAYDSDAQLSGYRYNGQMFNTQDEAINFMRSSGGGSAGGGGGDGKSPLSIKSDFAPVYERAVGQALGENWENYGGSMLLGGGTEGQADPLYQQWKAQFEQGIADTKGRAAPQMASVADVTGAQADAAQLDLGYQQGFRGDQQALAEAMAKRAAGNAPSAAELQLQQAQGSNLRAAQALMASNPGLSPAQAVRAASQQLASANAQTQNQMAQLRAQEQAQAEQAYAGVLQGARGQDIGLIGQQADLTQQTNLANQQMIQQADLANQQMAMETGQFNVQQQMQMQQMNDQLIQYYTNMGMTLDDAQRQARMTVKNNYMELEEARANRAASLAQTIIGGEYGVSTTGMQADAQLASGIIGGLTGGLGALGGALFGGK